VNKGSLATIGRSAAVADLGKIELSGLPAWIAWLGLHLLFLVGFRNRLVVLFEWAWSFLSYDRGARLITGPIRRKQDGRNEILRPGSITPGPDREAARRS
jgi:NADH dehydrogenase